MSAFLCCFVQKFFSFARVYARARVHVCTQTTDLRTSSFLKPAHLVEKYLASMELEDSFSCPERPAAGHGLEPHQPSLYH
jgi:hypothetical protein